MALDRLLSLNMVPPPGAVEKQISPFQAPIPGQALTMAPGQLPSERPPQFADMEDALDHLMKRMLSETQAMRLLALLDAGVPIDFLVKNIVKTGMQEGLWAASGVYLLTPPLTVLFIRMAQAAKIDYILHASPKDEEKIPELMMRLGLTRISSGKVEDAQKAGMQTYKDVKPKTAKAGITNIRSFA